MPGLLWSEIRDAATEYAARGWPVVPGTYRLTEEGPWLGAPGAEGLVPVAGGPFPPPADAEGADEVWSRRPYSVLLACGPDLGAIRVGAGAGRVVAGLLSAAGLPAPIASTGPHSFVLVTAPGRVRGRAGVLAARRWVPLPPGVPCGQITRWSAHPADCDWVLPEAARVLDALHGRAVLPLKGEPSWLPLSA